MKKRTDIFAAFLVAILVAIGGTARAATYYVSSSAGNDSNNGTSPATPWATLRTHVNGGSFNPGDVIYLKRGDTWNEQLIPPSNGLSGSPIQFDAYGTGAAPVITGAAPIAFATGSWTYDSGNTWRATIATTITSATADMVRFGNVYGAKRTGASCASVITSKYDWCVSWPILYVYSPAAVNPTTTYAAEGSIVPIIGTPTGLQMVYVNGKSWLTFQHIKVQMFDFVGVGVAGAADNLVFANMESDGMVPYGTTPHGFYVYAANPANIQFLNDEVRAHDFGWGASDDRNLIGRYSTRTFTLARLARTQSYFLRLFDTSFPPRYSRYAAALHVDYPYV